MNSSVANHGRIAYVNKDDRCFWLRLGAIRRCLYPWKSHGVIRVLLLIHWRFKLSCKFSHSDYEALWVLKGIWQSLFLLVWMYFHLGLLSLLCFHGLRCKSKFRYFNTSVLQRPQQMCCWGYRWIARKHFAFILAQLSNVLFTSPM